LQRLRNSRQLSDEPSGVGGAAASEKLDGVVTVGSVQSVIDDSVCDAAMERQTKLLAEVRKRSKVVLLLVTDKTSERFVPRALETYLKRNGLEPQMGGAADADAVEANVRKLIGLLDTGDKGLGYVSDQLAHACVREVVSPSKLQEVFPQMQAAYSYQELSYGRNSRYGEKWKISCYVKVKPGWTPRIDPHEPMVACMTPIMDECVARYREWYCRKKNTENVDIEVLNCFVTRYLPKPGEDRLDKHIDGHNVNGSIILALPTNDLFEGGELHVWDRPNNHEYVYAMKPGDIIYLLGPIWHQAMNIRTGTRWALVLFLGLSDAR